MVCVCEGRGRPFIGGVGWELCMYLVPAQYRQHLNFESLRLLLDT